MAFSYTDNLPANDLLLMGLEGVDLAMVKRALKKGADPHSVDEENRSIFDVLLKSVDSNNRSAFVNALLEHGHNPNHRKSPMAPTSFERCLMRGDLTAANLMLSNSKFKVDLLAEDSHGWLPSFAAVCHMGADFLERLQHLFESEIWPDRQDLPCNHLWTHRSKDGTNALMVASDKPLSMAWLLSNPKLDLTSALEEKCEDGKTVLWYAAESKQSGCVRMLLEAGARVDTRNHHGRSMIEHLRSNQLGKRSSSTTEDPSVRKTRDLLESAMAMRNATRAIEAVLADQPKTLSP